MARTLDEVADEWLINMVDHVEGHNEAAAHANHTEVHPDAHAHDHKVRNQAAMQPVVQHMPECPFQLDQPVIHRPKECQGQVSKKRRCQWTPELHSMFEAAVRKAGPQCTPSTVHAHMDVTNLKLDFDLTVAMVKSHLQKYKLECQCNAASAQLIPCLPVPVSNQRSQSQRNDAGAVSPSQSVDDPRVSSKSDAILITILDAPQAMGVLVRTFTGYTLKYEYEADTNTLVLRSLPPERQPPKLDACAFGLGTLSLLRGAEVHDQRVDELSMAFQRRCVLPYPAQSSDVDEWKAQLVSTGEGDKTVCLQIEKATLQDKAKGAIAC